MVGEGVLSLLAELPGGTNGCVCMQVIQLQPENPHAFFRRAFANKSVGKFDEAAEDFESARSV